MKRKLLALFLSVLMMLSALPLTALANAEFQTLLEGDTVMYKKTLDADGSTYTVTVSDPSGDGVIPNLSIDNKYQEMPWHATDVTVVIFDETITEIGTFTVCLNKGAQQVTDIHFKAPKVTAAVNAVVDYTGGGLKATVHAYSTWDFALSSKFAGISYYEAEAFDAKYTALWDIKNAEAETYKDTILAATNEFNAFPENVQTQLAARKIKLDSLNAILNGDTPAVDDSKLLFPDDTITVEKLLNTDGVTYTVIISDPLGDGALPARISAEYEGMPWHDYDVTTVIFDETITSLVSLTIRLVNSHKIKEIHFKAPEVKTVANCVVDYSNDPGRQATVYAYSTWTYALSAKFAGIVYYEAKEFIDEYASLWSLGTADAPFYEKDIAAAVAAYALVPSIAKTQLITQKAKLDELSEAIGLETPETNENLLFENDTVLFKKALNDDGETYTVTVSDPMGDGILPNLSSIAASMPWHTNDVTAVIFDETIVGISAQTIYLTSTAQILKDIYFLAPYVSVPVNAIVDYSNAPGRQATVHAHGTFTYELSEKFAGVSYYEAEDFIAKHADVFDLDTDAAKDNRTAIAAAIADYMTLPATVQKTLTAEKLSLDELGAVLGLSGTTDSTSFLIDDINHILKISGSGTLTGDTRWNDFKDSIEKIVIEDGITTVAADTFSGFTALKTVDLPFSITSIAAGAFPTTAFELHGWLNHVTGQFAEANANVSLKLKELRILSLGNSHTLNYTSFFADIIGDLKAGLDTKIIHERIVTGSRRLVSRDESATTGNHYDAAHNLDNVSGVDYPDSTDYNRYVAAFAKTWDIIIVQDYRESTRFGASFADEMPKVMEWLHEDAEGTKIVWFADWVENVNSNDFSYANSIAAVKAVEALDEGDKPDYIVVASTIIENARNTYFGTSMNPDGICSSKPGTSALPILESDGAHMSYELGQYMLGNAVMYQILSHFGNLLPIDNSFNYFALQKTDPVNADWIGEFVPEYRKVIEEICTHSYQNRFAETASAYTVDPAIAKHEALLEILKNVAVPKTLTQTALNVLYKSGAVVEAINALGFSVEAGDITATLNDNEYTVYVDCQYGYTASEGVTYTAPLSTATDKSVAKIGNTKYATLKEAIDAAENGDTVTLLDNTVLTESLPISASLTVDLNDFEITATTAVFTLTSGANLTLTNGKVTTYGSKSHVISSNAANSITVQSATLTAYDSRVIYHTAETGNVEILVTNASLTAKNSVAIYLADKQAASEVFNVISIESSAVSGKSAIDAKRTHITVKGASELTSTVNVAMLTAFKKSGAVGYAIALSGNETQSLGSITVMGGKFQGEIGIEPALEGATNTATVAISGGTFDRPVPTEFCAEGYTPKNNGNGTYGVTSGSEPTDASLISYQVTKAENGKFSLRAIAGINSLNYKNFGYEVTVTTENGTKTVSGTSITVYSALFGDKISYSIKEHFGFEYAALATVTELDPNSESTKLEICAYVTTSSGEKLYGESLTLLYTGDIVDGFPTFSIVK